jgi:hypothetical protein
LCGRVDTHALHDVLILKREKRREENNVEFDIWGTNEREENDAD